MADLRYKAYISYSHRDERWARWLHRALESYSIPRNLVGNKTNAGSVPARIRPVFRDRDDLTSSSDLSSNIKQALTESENLIVICSPDAVASRWVNEEIRQFARLGRADRIFCIIVGDNSADDGSVSDSFPAALAEIGIEEPLAADVRKWADGKHIARLKLIAGLLGIRLDQLRQRDLQRRHKRQIVAGLGILATLTLAVLTVLSQISERQEREKAEQLATFIVDLGERIQSDADLETRALISAEAFRHLQSLDPNKLSAETGKKVALALRQMSHVSQLKGRPDEALESFERSRDLLSRLAKKFPQIPDLLFQLGNAEFYIGNLHEKQGRYESALEAMQSYHSITRRLVDSEPENLDWIMELAYSHNNLAAVQLSSGMVFDEEMQAHVAEAVRLFEMVKESRPEDAAVTDGYATILAWAADAQRRSCNLENAMDFRIRVTELRKVSAQADPGNNDLKKRYAYDLTGLSKLQIQVGRLELAEQNLELAILLLQQLSAADPSNVRYRQNTLVRQFSLAKVIGESGRMDTARSMMEMLELKLRPGGEVPVAGSSLSEEYIDLLIAYADIESRLGRQAAANEHLQTAMRLQLDSSNPQQWDNFDHQRVQRARYQWWDQNGEEGLDRFTMQIERSQKPTEEFRSCIEADMAARMYVIEDNKTSAAREVAYLESRGYADPGFIRFCEKHELCGS